MSDKTYDNTPVSFGAEDLVLPFQLETSAIRGRLVRLDSSIDTILRQHDYPEPVARLLAETAAVAAALGSSLKLDGVFTLQSKSDGPVGLVVADVTSDGAVRAYSQFAPETIAQDASAKALLGKGYLVFTVDQNLGGERYQGVVQLEGESLTEAFQTYFRQSEQIPTGLMAAARRDEKGQWHAACLMLQRMPREGGENAPADTSIEDDWLRTMALMQTCTPAELTDPALGPETLLFRLFHEEGVRVYDAKSLRHECRCSRERIGSLLSTMSEDDVQHMVQDDGQITVNCQFCARSYAFDLQQIEALRAQATGPESGSESR